MKNQLVLKKAARKYGKHNKLESLLAKIEKVHGEGSKEISENASYHKRKECFLAKIEKVASNFKYKTKFCSSEDSPLNNM